MHFVSLNPGVYRITRSGCLRAQLCADNAPTRSSNGLRMTEKSSILCDVPLFYSRKVFFFFDGSKSIFF